ncbi:MAG TPA: SH3 domain-containing protein [Niabella sp.]|nr:SH3 domain-containing protein [Niabella sp.]HOZ95728.1 SH3 domain-containing protein [Niabella sp.]HQW15971.1 SH3 domain-containing protein [Niabella sp.]HQX21176.1 SH3 domain-containing protein [Niabella sp.]HQX40733.1 SH3 domain-containing protein [Niabella sp.]
MKKIFLSVGFVCASLFVLAQNGKFLAEKSGKGAVLIHEVQAKEGLYSLSRIYGIKVAEIAAANDFDKDKNLLIGQRIKIPLTETNLSQKKGKTPVFYAVSDGETLTAISNRFNKVSLKDLKTWNKIEGDVVPRDKDLIVGYFTGTATSSSVVMEKKKETENVASVKNSSKGQPASITGSNINIRKGPATDQPVVAIAQLDEVVDVLRTINKEWAFIRTTSGAEGYISSQFLKPADKKPETPKTVVLKTAFITGSNINIRKGPSTDEEIVATAQQNEVVDLLKNVNAEWTSIRTKDGTEGFVATQFLNTTGKKTEPIKPVVLKTALIAGSNINIRKGPSTNEPIVATLQQDEVVEILKNVNEEWTGIRIKDGTEGFVASRFLNTTGKKPEIKKEETLKTATIIGTNINVRRGPATTEPAIASVQQDEVITLLKKVDDDWTAIRLADGTEGYIASKFINTSEKKPSSELSQNQNSIEKAKDETIENVVNNIEKKVIEKEDVRSELPTKTANTSFKDIYLSQGNPNFTSEKTVVSGIFKTNKGWKDEEYYILIDGPAIGSIVKLLNPENNQTIYAKVLGKMSGLAYADGFDIRISEAAASKLLANSQQKFTVKIAY